MEGKIHKSRAGGFAIFILNLPERSEGYLANLKLRPGSDHSQKGTEAFLRQTLRYAGLMSDATFLVRMDSGNDSLGNIAAGISATGSDLRGENIVAPHRPKEGRDGDP